MFRTLVALIRVARLQFVLISVVGFVVGYAATENVNWYLLLFGINQHMLAKVADGFINAYSDRHEDQINLPDYSAEVQQIGYEHCRRIGVVLYAICGALALTLLTPYPVPTLLGIFSGVLPAIFYSVGPRLKRHSFASPVLIFLWAAIPLLVGWTLGSGGSVTKEVWVCFLLLGSFMAVNRITRYFNDAQGDIEAGVQTIYTRLTPHPKWWVWQWLLALPYLLTATVVAAGFAPFRYLWLLTLWPAAFMNASLLCRAKTEEQRKAVWDWATLNATVTHLGVLVVFYPSTVTWAMAAAVMGIRIILSELKLDYRAQMPMSRMFVLAWQAHSR